VSGDPKIARATQYPLTGGAIDKLRETNDNKPNETGDTSGQMAAGKDGGKLEECRRYISGGGYSDAELAQGEDGESHRQKRLLEEWAAKTTSLIAPGLLEQLQLVSDSTSEHTVRYDESRKRAIKETFPDEFGWVPILDSGRWTAGIARPLDYIRRWQLFNQVFGDSVRLEGARRYEDGKVSIVISQSWRAAGDSRNPNPTREEMEEFLHQAGFVPVPDSYRGWYRSGDGILLIDANPDNFVQTRYGTVPIDLPITQVGSVVI
jgi:hypothetical protein